MTIEPVTADRWSDLADLFERKGPRGGASMPSTCWCMWWRTRTGDAQRNREAMHEIVDRGDVPGLLAYEEDQAAGWVAVAPRPEFGQLQRSRTYGFDEGQGDVWAVTCFYVDPRMKRRGVARALLAAAVDHAFGRGGQAIEALPHRDGDYMGSPAMFEEARFERIRDIGARVLVRRTASAAEFSGPEGPSG
jgi:GNAT superfamily N-acetyltransferase